MYVRDVCQLLNLGLRGSIKYSLSALLSVCPYVHLSIFPGILLELYLVFSKFWHGARNSYEIVCDVARFSGKYVFAPKSGKMTKNK